jgi:hypothetical protein
MVSRRKFIATVGLGAVGTLATIKVNAQAMLSESDPQAIALGYKADTTKVDTKKYPKHTNQQKCTNCQVFVGKSDAAVGGCPLFAGKQVAGPGWCSAWAKKAA